MTTPTPAPEGASAVTEEMIHEAMKAWAAHPGDFEPSMRAALEAALSHRPPVPDAPEGARMLEELVAGLEGVTPGEWYPGHLGTDSTCQCRSIVDDGRYMGAIATVHVDNGLPVGEGGNDAPPADEAAANMRHIARCSPDRIRAIAAYVATERAAREAAGANVKRQGDIAEFMQQRAIAAEARVSQLEAALEPFAAVAEHDIGDDEMNEEFFQPMTRHNKAPRLNVGHFRAVLRAKIGG